MYQINNKGDWISLKKRIRLAYPVITEKDLELDDGDERILLTRLQNKLVKSKKEVITIIDKL
jgi:hypothetical protein